MLFDLNCSNRQVGNDVKGGRLAQRIVSFKFLYDRNQMHLKENSLIGLLHCTLEGNIVECYLFL